MLHERISVHCGLKASRLDAIGTAGQVAPGPEQWPIDPTRHHSPPVSACSKPVTTSLNVDSDGNGGGILEWHMLTRRTVDRKSACRGRPVP